MIIGESKKAVCLKNHVMRTELSIFNILIVLEPNQLT